MRRRSVWLALLAAPAAGCAQQIPPAALQLTQESLAQRQLQTRRFETEDESLLLSSSVSVLQDLGYQIGSTHAPLGFVFATKQADAVEVGQVIGAVLVAVVFGVAVPIDKDQQIRVSVITRKVDRGTALRVTFQRVVKNTKGEVSRIEALNSPQLYQEFFDRLSKSVFLEANEI
ncbi:MAG: hypothetical protein IT556_03965 [Acetobacteraceae bacterium]|nr:hypothetical protein [Acetobacteraceae bacterium]